MKSKIIKTIICTVFILSIYNVYSQSPLGRQFVIGLRGYSIRIDTPYYTHDTLFAQQAFPNATSSICDSNGNLLFMSNGMNVMDAQGIYIEGGDTLAPLAMYLYNQGYSRSTQGSLILPMSHHKYYFVNCAWTDTQLVKPAVTRYTDLLQYSIIERVIVAGNTTYKVNKRMVPAIQGEKLHSSCMQACRHANGRDWWLLKLGGDSINGTVIRKLLFTQDSVYDKGTQQVPIAFWNYADSYAQMAFSENGKRVAMVMDNAETILEHGKVYIADFDRCSGDISNIEYKIINAHPTGQTPPAPQIEKQNAGVALSPNGKIIYVLRATHIVQYNTDNNSQYKVWGMDTSENYFMLYRMLNLMPDGKIYIGYAHGFSKQMSTIDNPDVGGVGCNFCRKCVVSQSNWGILHSPSNMPNYSLGEDPVNPCWPVGSDELIVMSDEIKVYPNPTSGKLVIENGDGKLKELYNAIGQLMLRTKDDEIEVSKYSKGVYYLKCAGQTKKVVVE